ncbi:hypothetical protein [Gloeothece verrucosa]|uniref:hypothetical protein n=1 Tax=Gloeothece verrucosa TaxID=2546359 RepID=UPI00030AD96A|nr:hypothetical protein [Gloeothece verrucosa]
MAIDAVEGEQQLIYSASRQDHLSRLLNMEGILTNSTQEKESSDDSSTFTSPSLLSTKATSIDDTITPTSNTHSPRRKRTSTASKTSDASTVKKGRKKTTSVKNDEIVSLPHNNETLSEESVKVEEADSIDATSTQKKTKRRVGARKPKRDQVGSEPEKA